MVVARQCWAAVSRLRQPAVAVFHLKGQLLALSVVVCLHSFAMGHLLAVCLPAVLSRSWGQIHIGW